MNDSALKSLLEHLSDGVYYVDTDRRIQYWSPGAERLTGYAADQVVGRLCYDNILMHVDDEGTQLCQTMCPLAHTLKDGANREADVYLRHAEGHRCPVAVRVAPVRDGSGEIVGAVEVFNDITERVKAMEQLERLRQDSLLDLLTGLPNRRFLEMQLASRMLELSRYGRGFGVLFMDVDRFKQVNDTYGHEAGDSALRMVGTSVQAALRGFDVVGRWGGEEFVALVMDVGASELGDTAERVRVLVERSHLPVEPSPLQVTLSIGATLARPDESVTDLVSRADRLMYLAKKEGRNRVARDPGTP